MKKWMKLLLGLVILAACAFFGLKAWDALTDQSHMEETFYQVESDKLTNDIRAVFLTDLHLSEFGEDNCELVERVRKLNPDMILIGGDMNKVDVSDYSPVLSLMRQLVKITDTYYALGNHELTVIVTKGRQIYDDIEATGVTMLNDRYVRVNVNGNTLCIGGLSESGGGVQKYSNGIIGKLASQEEFKILISHYPSNFDLIAQSDIDLVLSGHLHGGQIHLPYFDGLYSYEDGLLPPYTEGMFLDNGTTMIVSRGLGNSHAIPRINNPPELIIVDITSSTTAKNTLRLMARLAENNIQEKQSVSTAEPEESAGFLRELLKQKEDEREQMVEEMKADVKSVADTFVALPLMIPSALYAPAGEEITVKLSNILASKTPADYTLSSEALDVSDGSSLTLPGESGEVQFSVTNKAGSTVDYSMYLTRVAPDLSGGSASVNKNVLLLGDSFMARGFMPCEVQRLINEDYGYANVSFVGTRMAWALGKTCLCEARGGYGFADLMKLDDAEARGAEFPNPYRKDDTVSLKTYLENKSVAAPDVIAVYMGIYDLTQYGSGKSDAAQVVASRAKDWIELMHSDYPDAKILLCGLAYLSDDNGTTDAAAFNKQIIKINEAYQSLCGDDGHSAYCEYIDTALMFDRANGYKKEEVEQEDGSIVLKQTDWVHPSEAGFKMMAKPLAAALAAALAVTE